MAHIRVGMNLSHRPPLTTRDAAAAADAAGIDVVTLGDAQGNLRDVYAVLALCALATSRVALGPFVANPMTRHPDVTAGAIATIDELSNGRAYLGIGRGNASVMNAALPRATPAQVREAVLRIDASLGRSKGAARPVSWARGRVPIIVHAGGPAMMRVAAEAADGAVFRWGDASPERVAAQIRATRELRSKGPRAGEPFTVWSVMTVCVAPSADAARAAIDVSYRARSLPEREWPAELAERFVRYRERYHFEHHASKTNKVNKELLEELGLAEFTLERYAAVGTPRDVARQLERAVAAGVDTIVLSLDDAAPERASDDVRIADVAAIRRELTLREAAT